MGLLRFSFSIIGFVNFVLSFQFSFWRWLKIWLIIACDYSAQLLVKSFWGRYFSSAIFLVNFVGFLNRLRSVCGISSLAKSGFLNWLDFFGKGFGKFYFGSFVKFFRKGFGMWFLVLAKE